MRHFLVTGRVVGDDEDSFLQTVSDDVRKAKEAFITLMLKRDESIARVEVCVCYVMWSDTPIHLEEFPQW